jgi:PIN domain nuclease of toxin-antitoxin system
LQKEGNVVIPVDAEEFLADLIELYGLSAITPNDEIMLRSANLPDFHKDPADRIIIATALISGMPIVTGDNKFSQYGVRTIC